MLAGLFYTRVPPEKLAKLPQKDDEPNIKEKTRVEDLNAKACFNEKPSLENRSNQSGKFVSSADVFGIRGEQLTPRTSIQVNKKKSKINRNLSIEKILAFTYGFLVRKRMQSSFALVLKKQIFEDYNPNNNKNNSQVLLEEKRSKRKFHVLQLINFLKFGTILKEEKSNKNYINQNQIETEKKKTLTLESKEKIPISLYSSNKSKETGDNILASLKEAVGMKDLSSDMLVKNITPNFLEERRSVFLKTIFSLEDREGYFTQVPKLIVGEKMNNLDLTYCLAPLCRGGYFRFLDNVERTCADL